MAKTKSGDPVKPVESESDVEGEEGEDEASSEVGSSDTEPEPEPEQTQTQTTKKHSSTPAALKKSQPYSSSKPQQQPSSSLDEEESGSESDSESDGSDSNVKPLASKPMDDSQKSNNGARKPRSKSNTLEPASPIKSAGAKRPADEKLEDNDIKKSKKEPEAEPEIRKSSATKADAKKPLFQRLWSEDDEIVVLKGMIDYKELNNADPVANLNDFHDFIKKSLHVDVTRAQLQDKIRRLKKKFVNNMDKGIEGEDRTFTKPHEQKAYEWSKKIWLKENGKETRGERVGGSASANANGSVARKSSSNRTKMVEIGEAKEVRRVEVANGVVEMLAAQRLCANDVSIEERILMTGDELFEGVKRVESEREWKKLRLKEMELHLKKLDLLRAQTKLVLDVLKSTDH